MTLKTPGVDIIESQDWGPLGGYTREYRGYYSHEPLVTVSPLGCPAWAPPPQRGSLARGGVLGGPASLEGGVPKHHEPLPGVLPQAPPLSQVYRHKHRGEVRGKMPPCRRFFRTFLGELLLPCSTRRMILPQDYSSKCDVELDRRPDFHQNSGGKPSTNRETLPSVEKRATTHLPRKSKKQQGNQTITKGQAFYCHNSPPPGSVGPTGSPRAGSRGFRITLDLRSAPTPSSPSQPSRPPPPPYRAPPIPSPPLF